jgi:hypothetical protein
MNFPNFYFKRRKRPSYLKAKLSSDKKYDGVIHLTGGEKWIVYNDNAVHTFCFKLGTFIIENGKCTHYNTMSGTSWIDNQNGIYLSHTGLIIITDLNFNNVEDFKTYVKSQYENGTPISILYNLLTEV